MIERLVFGLVVGLLVYWFAGHLGPSEFPQTYPLVKQP